MSQEFVLPRVFASNSLFSRCLGDSSLVLTIRRFSSDRFAAASAVEPEQQHRIFAGKGIIQQFR